MLYIKGDDDDFVSAPIISNDCHCLFLSNTVNFYDMFYLFLFYLF